MSAAIDQSIIDDIAPTRNGLWHSIVSKVCSLGRSVVNEAVDLAGDAAVYSSLDLLK